MPSTMSPVAASLLATLVRGPRGLEFPRAEVQRFCRAAVQLPGAALFTLVREVLELAEHLGRHQASPEARRQLLEVLPELADALEATARAAAGEQLRGIEAVRRRVTRERRRLDEAEARRTPGLAAPGRVGVPTSRR